MLQGVAEKTVLAIISILMTVLFPMKSPACCSVLECVAASCSVVECVAACCSVLQRVVVCCSVL